MADVIMGGLVVAMVEGAVYLVADVFELLSCQTTGNSFFPRKMINARAFRGFSRLKSSIDL
ncbi:MAG: hypothetical protein KBT18_03295 [Comamonas sp.]|nr:hypothetical protein [Candidatus Comamonas equi]